MEAVSSGLTNPIRANKLIGIAVKDLTIDNRLSTSDMRYLFGRFRSLNPDAVDMITLPTSSLVVHGQYAGEKLKQPEAKADIDRINGKGLGTAPAAPAVQPNQVRVRVLNGTGADGLAGQVSAALQTVGFSIADLFAADEGIGQVKGHLGLRGLMLTMDFDAESAKRLSVSGSGRMARLISPPSAPTMGV